MLSINSNTKTMNRFPKKLLVIISLFAILATFLIAFLPEQPAKLLTDQNGWVVKGPRSSQLSLTDFSKNSLQLRHSVIEENRSKLFRTWTPDSGIVFLSVSSAEFLPSPYMSVIITGNSLTKEGCVQAVIECKSNGQKHDIFRGDVNNNVSEAIVALPNSWHNNNTNLKLISTEKNSYIGIGSVYEISFLSYMKSSFLGRIPFFITALLIFSLVMLVGASISNKMGWNNDPLPVAFLSLGLFSLWMFYLSNGLLAFGIPENWRWINIAITFLVLIIIIWYIGYSTLVKTAQQLYPYFRIWGLFSFVFFILLCLTYNGLGNWEPNFRFWPAEWSSDNELPWKFAEAIRNGSDFKTLFGSGSGWLPTDRPPLMTGAYLLIADVFDFLQINNDGLYLRGHAYNSAAIVLNSLWIPVIWWLLKNLILNISEQGRKMILVFVACMPFALFNTIYGWPKAFGASFALLSFGLAWKSHNAENSKNKNFTIFLFFLFGTLSMLAHSSTAIFLAPLGIFFLWWNLKKNIIPITVSFSIALFILASWGIFKILVLPSPDPLIKYALTGDYGFVHPEIKLWEMIVDRYQMLNFESWFEIKKNMLLGSFKPITNSLVQFSFRPYFDAKGVDILRQWDEFYLSRGNIAIPLFVIISTIVSFRLFILGKKEKLKNNMPFLALIGISVSAWVLIVIFFLIPPIIHHCPQAAIFGLTLGGMVIVHHYFPSFFRFMLIAQIVYTSIIWIVLPINNALYIDLGAAIVLAIICVSLLFHRIYSD
jgi:hypothetical protein